MEQQDGNKFKELLTAIDETYSIGFSETQIKLWWNMFKPHSIQNFETAVYAYMSCPDSGMYPPKPASIMKFITGTARDNEQLVKDTAEQAWHAIEGEIRRIGSYGTLKLENKQALAAVKALGGWKHICSLTSEQMVWAHKEFTAAYENYERADISMLPDKLPGRFELEEHKQESVKGLKALSDGVKAFQNRNNARIND